MSLLAKLRTKYGEGIGVELYFSFPELFDDQKTYLDADSAVGVSSLSANGVNFSTSQYIVIGQPGNLKTEIVQVNTVTSPTSTTITLVGTTSFAHNRGDLIRFIPYNQIIPTRSTDGGSNFTPLSAINIRADSTETYLQRTGDASTDVYKFQFSNSSSALVSAYSDQVVASGYADNTVYSVKKRAMDQLGEKKTDLVNDQFLNDSLMEARRTLDQDPRILRWTFRTKFDTTLGQMLAGQWSIASPTDLRDRNTYKNVLNLRFGNQNRPCIYQDRVRFSQNYLNVVHTTVSSAYTSGGTSLVLTSTHNLDSSGVITVAGNSVAQDKVAVTYSANNKSTNTLTITSPGRNISAGTDAWQRATFGLPTAYTIDNAVIYFDVPLGSTWDSQDVLIDYYRTLTAIDSDADTFDEPFYDLFVPWLKWKIAYLKANGKIDRSKNADYQEWQEGMLRVIGQEVSGQRINFVPDTEGFLSSTE
jgi:hypothetical protein